jgi:hypothetical protein
VEQGNVFPIPEHVSFAAAALIALEVEDLITSTHPLDQVANAIRDAATGRGLKAGIAFPR